MIASDPMWNALSPGEKRKHRFQSWLDPDINFASAQAAHYYRERVARFTQAICLEETPYRELSDSLCVSRAPRAIGFMPQAELVTSAPDTEVSVALTAMFNGEPVQYVVWDLLASDVGLTAGREIWGWPKKLCNAWIEKGPKGMMGVVKRPKGVRICTGFLQPARHTTRRGGYIFQHTRNREDHPQS